MVASTSSVGTVPQWSAVGAVWFEAESDGRRKLPNSRSRMGRCKGKVSSFAKRAKCKLSQRLEQQDDSALVRRDFEDLLVRSLRHPDIASPNNIHGGLA